MFIHWVAFLLACVVFTFGNVQTPQLGPVVINTWDWVGATALAYSTLTSNRNPDKIHLDALDFGLHYCETDSKCGWSVGSGGSPDENGETTLDAAIFDGDKMNAGVVTGLRRVNYAIGVARSIMEHTKHTVLTGDLATQYALEMGFTETDLHSNASVQTWRNWKNSSCQPNFRQNVTPDPTTSCGPYRPIPTNPSTNSQERPQVTHDRHDTLGMVVLSASGSVAAGATTNGATWKVPGRVGDVGVIGAGIYADSEIGGCAATGDGDIMLRFLPCFLTIENLRNGIPLQEAADRSLRRIAKFFPKFLGAIVVLTRAGEFTGSAYGWTVTISVRTPRMDNVTVYTIVPITKDRGSYLTLTNNSHLVNTNKINI